MTTGARSSLLLIPPGLLSVLLGFCGQAAATPKEGAEIEACASASERGQRVRRAGKLLDARDEFRACGLITCPSVVREDCAGWSSELDEETPSIVIRARDARARDVIAVHVYANGRLITDHLDGGPIEMDPGRYDFRYETASGAVSTETVLLTIGEQKREIEVRFGVPLDVDGAALPAPPPAPAQPPLAGPAPMAPAPPPRAAEGPNRTLGYVFASIGVAALGAFGYFDFQGQNGYSRLEAEGCGKTKRCPPTEIDPVRTDFVLAGSFLAASVVCAGVATWQFLVPHRGSAAALLQVRGAPGHAFATFQLRF